MCSCFRGHVFGAKNRTANSAVARRFALRIPRAGRSYETRSHRNFVADLLLLGESRQPTSLPSRRRWSAVVLRPAAGPIRRLAAGNASTRSTLSRLPAFRSSSCSGCPVRSQRPRHRCVCLWQTRPTTPLTYASSGDTEPDLSRRQPGTLHPAGVMNAGLVRAAFRF